MISPAIEGNIRFWHSSFAAESSTVRVGRWMSQAEADAMAASGRVQAPLN
jgi:hypothetical protein